MQAITRLIKKIASHPSTEELILFVADDDKMVKACRKLQQLMNNTDDRDIAELEVLCRSHQISLDILFREVHHILAVFSPDAVDN